VRKTLTMMDGSRHRYTSGTNTSPASRTPTTHERKRGVQHFSQDKTNFDGTKFTSIKFADGTEVTMTRTRKAKCTGGVTAADGRHGVLPDEFSPPALTTVGGALTGLEDRPSAESDVSPQSVENLGNAGSTAGRRWEWRPPCTTP